MHTKNPARRTSTVLSTSTPSTRPRVAELPPDAPILRFVGAFRFLSNFYDAPVAHTITWRADDYVTWVFPSAEHAYQASKAQDVHQAARIRRATTPADARRRGKLLAARSDWDAMRVAVMREVVRQKFQQVDVLQDRLLATGDRLLIEGNTWGDQFWGAVQVHGGIGRPVYQPLNALDQAPWFGENWLGQILMERRSAIRAARGGRS